MQSMEISLCCEDAAVMISRNLDQDLIREDILQLYQHLARCHDCQQVMNDLAANESILSDFNTLFNQVHVHPHINAKIKETIQKQFSPSSASPQKSKQKQTWAIWQLIRDSSPRVKLGSSLLAAAGCMVLVFAFFNFNISQQNDLQSPANIVESNKQRLKPVQYLSGKVSNLAVNDSRGQVHVVNNGNSQQSVTLRFTANPNVQIKILPHSIEAATAKIIVPPNNYASIGQNNSDQNSNTEIGSFIHDDENSSPALKLNFVNYR